MDKKHWLEIDTGGAEGPCDEGLFLSYGTIVAEGATLEECLETAEVDLIDQDGGEWAMREADEDWMQQLVAVQWYEQVCKVSRVPLETIGDFLSRAERTERTK